MHEDENLQKTKQLKYDLKLKLKQNIESNINHDISHDINQNAIFNSFSTQKQREQQHAIRKFSNHLKALGNNTLPYESNIIETTNLLRSEPIFSTNKSSKFHSNNTLQHISKIHPPMKESQSFYPSTILTHNPLDYELIIIRIGVIGTQPSSVDTFGLNINHSSLNQQFIIRIPVTDAPQNLFLRMNFGSKSILFDKLQDIPFNIAKIFRLNSNNNMKRVLQIPRIIKVLGNFIRLKSNINNFNLEKLNNEEKYIEIIRLLAKEQRLGVLPIITLTQQTSALKGVEVGANIIRDQCGIAEGEWIENDQKSGISYLLLHRFLPLNMNVKLSKEHHIQTQNNLDTDKNENYSLLNQSRIAGCKLSFELDAREVDANMYQVETRIIDKDNQLIVSNQLFQLKGKTTNLFTFHFPIPPNQNYLKMKQASLLMTNMTRYHNEDETTFNHPTSYSSYQSFIISIFIQRIGFFSSSKNNSLIMDS